MSGQNERFTATITRESVLTEDALRQLYDEVNENIKTPENELGVLTTESREELDGTKRWIQGELGKIGVYLSEEEAA
jgi:hypothetical protein